MRFKGSTHSARTNPSYGATRSGRTAIAAQTILRSYGPGMDVGGDIGDIGNGGAFGAWGAGAVPMDPAAANQAAASAGKNQAAWDLINQGLDFANSALQKRKTGTTSDVATDSSGNSRTYAFRQEAREAQVAADKQQRILQMGMAAAGAVALAGLAHYAWQKHKARR